MGISSTVDPENAQITWQIVCRGRGYIAQRRCEVCGGSGLVLEEKEYFRCPGCGGFLPWQSWKRFFSVKAETDSDAALSP
ncbi:hypothetical protein MLD38_012756 [Melastoma candidum]|uniref:Uncharacterized protein n=1 Tax=Melastoma candidum TaxID=119954 RepID=A0ACB9R7M3_9MYRT|nr:hypothetical protein MLD38_012756 [Melastoma candidum]